jgi:hypothetical protein
MHLNGDISLAQNRMRCKPVAHDNSVLGWHSLGNSILDGEWTPSLNSLVEVLEMGRSWTGMAKGEGVSKARI